MKYIPDCFKVNECAECYKIITARVYQSSIQPKTVVNFVPLSKYQFSIEIDFGGAYISSAFTLIVEINKELPDKFDGCFTEE